MEHALASLGFLKTTVRGGLIAIALSCGLAGGAAAATGALPTTLALDHCSWDRPGVNPFMGDVVAAVDRYPDIPPEVRTRLKARMAKREYDDLVSIRRDNIAGRGGYQYGNAITDMHFGTHQLCRSVTRASWSPTMEERGLVYCESGHCILVPTVCRNVSRVTRRGVGNEIAEGPLLLDVAPPGVVAAGAANELPLALAGVPTTDVFGTAAAAPGGGGGGSFGSFGAAPSPGPTARTSSASPIGSDSPGLPTVTAVPEPQTWASLLGGLAALALFARRRRGVTRRAAASDSAR